MRFTDRHPALVAFLRRLRDAYCHPFRVEEG